jgi:phenylpropionate dioxygenase-like ring-hydroxylating dioxygenase large terminal subunit
MAAKTDWEFPHPSQVQTWFLLCRSAELRPGAVLSRDFLGRPIVLFRGKSGAACALSAHCSHMGTHLGRGIVVGDHLRCPLHHWEYDGQGVCRRIPATDRIPERACQASFPVAERYGGIFVFNGPEALFPAPSFSTVPEGEIRTGHGRRVRIPCPWYAVPANAFDMQHLQTVHLRALRDTPRVERVDRHRICLHYVSRVTGHSLTDRTMRRLSRDRISVRITCYGGSVLTVESDLGRAKSALLLGFMPVDGGTQITPVVGVRKTGTGLVDHLRVRMALWLYFGFLRRDVAIMDGMRFRPRLVLPPDEALRQYLEFLADLPLRSGVDEVRRDGEELKTSR